MTASGSTELRNRQERKCLARARTCSGSGPRLGSASCSLVFEIVVIVLVATGARRRTRTTIRAGVRIRCEARCLDGFAITYLVLGLHAFARCDRAELVRRVLATPLPSSPVKRWLLAGGGGSGWPIVIAVVAFFTIITAVLAWQSTYLVLVLAAFTVVTCWMVITFSFACSMPVRTLSRAA